MISTPLRASDLARRDGAAVLVQSQPLRVHWELRALTTSDGHDVICNFAASVRAVDTAVDRRMLSEVLLAGRDVATARDVVAHFEPALQAAAQREARRHTAEQSLAPGWSEMAAALTVAGKAVGFTCGVELLGPFTLNTTSPTLDQQRKEAVRIAMAEQRAQGERSRLQHVAETLQAVEQLRSSMPHLPASHMLQTIPSSNRRLVLRDMMEAEARGSPKIDLWCVAGSSLARIQMPMDSEPAVELIEVPEALGPLRSVSWVTAGAERFLLLGARGGVLVARGPNCYELFTAPSVDVTTGFNSVAALSRCNCIYAAHGEAGLWRWDMDQPNRPEQISLPATDLISGASNEGEARWTAGSLLRSDATSTLDSMRGTDSHPMGPRNLKSWGDRKVIFSVAHQVFVLDAESVAKPLGSGSTSNVIALFQMAGEIVIVHEDGTIATANTSDAKSPAKVVQRRGEKLRAATVLPWLGEERLLLSTAGGALVSVGLANEMDDGLVIEFASHHRTLRMLQATPRAVAAVSSDRQRVVLWNSWDPAQPLSEVYITARTRHRIADLSAGEAWA